MDFELETEDFEANPRFTRKCKVDGLLVSQTGEETNVSREVVSLVDVFEGYGFPKWSKGVRFSGAVKEIGLDGDEAFRLVEEWQKRQPGTEPSLYTSWAEQLGPLGLNIYKFSPRKWEQQTLDEFFGDRASDWKAQFPLARAAAEGDELPWYIEPCRVWHNLVVTLSWTVNVVMFLKNTTQFSGWVRYPHKNRGEVIVPDAFGTHSDPIRVHLQRRHSPLTNREEIPIPLNFSFYRQDSSSTLSDEEVERFVLVEFKRRTRHLTASHVSALPNPFTGELELSARSLYGYFILFLLELLVGDVEFFVCPGCGQTKTATGKAFGKGKTYCSDRCKKRFYRRTDSTK